MAGLLNWIEGSRLWLVLDRDAAKRHRSLAEATEQCIAGGVDAVVFRMKDADAIDAAHSAGSVRQVCSDAGVPFVLAHFHELVADLQPDAFHAGLADGELPVIRYKLPKQIALGYSAHSVTEAEHAMDAGADYVFLGPIFSTPSKEHYGEPLGLDVIAGSPLTQPVVYIGGMNRETIPLAVAAGAKRVAAISALLAVPDPREAARELKALLPD